MSDQQKLILPARTLRRVNLYNQSETREVYHMSETLLTRVPREELSEGARMAWDALNELTGTPTFVDVFANAPELLDFAMVQFYQNIFFDAASARNTSNCPACA